MSPQIKAATLSDTARTASQTSAPALDRPARRLLQALASPGAIARENAARPGHLAVAARKGKVTCVVASLPLVAAAPLVEQRLACWNADALTITADGKSLLRRMSAPPGADPFQTQHRELARESREPNAAPVTVDISESPLAWLARRRDRDGRPFLDAAAIEAGERFRRDVTVAQFLPSVTSNWSAHGAASRGDPGRTLLPSEVALAARQRVDRALDALGNEFAGLIVDACGFVKRLEVIESERGWPARSGKIVLRIALAQLARHYGLAASATGPERSRGVRHWGASDYRPAITPTDG